GPVDIVEFGSVEVHGHVKSRIAANIRVVFVVARSGVYDWLQVVFVGIAEDSRLTRGVHIIGICQLLRRAGTQLPVASPGRDRPDIPTKITTPLVNGFLVARGGAVICR